MKKKAKLKVQPAKAQPVEKRKTKSMADTTARISKSEVESISGYIADYISGKPVRSTAEEVDAVQVFAQRLVEDYGYSKTQIQTHPQFRVRKRPSDKEKSY